MGLQPIEYITDNEAMIYSIAVGMIMLGLLFLIIILCELFAYILDL